MVKGITHGAAIAVGFVGGFYITAVMVAVLIKDGRMQDLIDEYKARRV